MSTIAEHLAELEMLDSNRTEGVSSPMVQAGYMFLIVHYAEMIQERDPVEMAQARETVEQRLREQHPARAEEHITAWRAARPALRPAGVPAVAPDHVARELAAAHAQNSEAIAERAAGVALPQAVPCEAGHAPRGLCEFGPYGWRGVTVCKHCKQAPPDGVSVLGNPVLSEPPLSKRLFFKTGREYTKQGQRIGAQLLPNGGMLFVDIDRNVQGYIRPETVKAYDLVLTPGKVLWAYDHHEITQYWEGAYDYEDEIRQLQEATRAHTDW